LLQRPPHAAAQATPQQAEREIAQQWSMDMAEVEPQQFYKSMPRPPAVRERARRALKRCAQCALFTK